MNSFIRSYSVFAAHHPLLIMVIVALISFAAMKGSSFIAIEPTRFTDFFPPELEVMKTFRLVEDEFIGSRSMIIVVEPEEDAGAAMLADMREPEVVRYVDTLAAKLKDVEMVKGASTLADAVKSANGGRIPSSKLSMESAIRASPQAGVYITNDYAMTVVRISLGDTEGREAELMDDVRRVIESTTPPPGVKAEATGDPAIAVVFQESTGPDMQRTSRLSFIGILIIAVSIFSIRHGVIPMVCVAVGLFWAFGLMGLFGITISSTMAGFASMIMGIGIDFAIQVINRFREEKTAAKGSVTEEEAMSRTLSSVIAPMSTTALSALIGFRAMSLGELTMMRELGNVMSIGILTSMVAAITLVPALIVIIEKI